LGSNSVFQAENLGFTVPLHQARARDEDHFRGRVPLADELLQRIQARRNKGKHPVQIESTNFGQYLLRVKNGSVPDVAAVPDASETLTPVPGAAEILTPVPHAATSELIPPDAAETLTSVPGAAEILPPVPVLPPAAERSRLQTGIRRYWSKSVVEPPILNDLNSELCNLAIKDPIPPIPTDPHTELGNLSTEEPIPLVTNHILVSSDDDHKPLSEIGKVATLVPSTVSSELPRDLPHVFPRDIARDIVNDRDFFENFEMLSPLPPNFVADSPASRWDVVKRRLPFLFDPVARTMTLVAAGADSDARTCEIGTQTEETTVLTLQDLRSELQCLLPYFL
jgi:hypothetical protein